jgi:hypothetical protein
MGPVRDGYDREAKSTWDGGDGDLTKLECVSSRIASKEFKDGDHPIWMCIKSRLFLKEADTGE